MKIIKTQSNQTQIKISKNEWLQIGSYSGWFKKHADDIDLTKQKADTTELFTVMTQMRADLGGLQNNNDPQKAEAIKLRLQNTLNDVKQNNWVVRLDAEIGLDVDNLMKALEANDLTQFNRVLETFFNPNLKESKAQLDRLLQKQKGESIGTEVGLEQAVGDTGDAYA